MELHIKHQDEYSRGELLLRTFFGVIYLELPHAFLLMFVGIWAGILNFITFWAILFTGKHPRSFFDFQQGFFRWYLRLIARSFNLVDGYPAFGINGTDDKTALHIPYPEKMSRGLALVRVLFGAIYVIIPHIFLLYFVILGGIFVRLFGWWAVLITGKYPRGAHQYSVKMIRWLMRVNFYMRYMTDQYPPFHGRSMDNSMNDVLDSGKLDSGKDDDI